MLLGNTQCIASTAILALRGDLGCRYTSMSDVIPVHCNFSGLRGVEMFHFSILRPGLAALVMQVLPKRG